MIDWRIDADDGQIRLRIIADEARLNLACIRQDHINPRSAADHVAIG